MNVSRLPIRFRASRSARMASSDFFEAALAFDDHSCCALFSWAASTMGDAETEGPASATAEDFDAGSFGLARKPRPTMAPPMNAAIPIIT